jgi:hypothetical protein
VAQGACDEAQVKQAVVKAGFTPAQADDALRAVGPSLQVFSRALIPDKTRHATRTCLRAHAASVLPVVSLPQSSGLVQHHQQPKKPRAANIISEHLLPHSFVPKMGTQVELVQVGGGKRVSAAAADDGDAAASSSAAGGAASLEQQLRYLALISASESISISFDSTHDASAAALLLLKAHRDAAAAACSLPPSSASAASDLKEMIDGT